MHAAKVQMLSTDRRGSSFPSPQLTGAVSDPGIQVNQQSAVPSTSISANALDESILLPPVYSADEDEDSDSESELGPFT